MNIEPIIVNDEEKPPFKVVTSAITEEIVNSEFLYDGYDENKDMAIYKEGE